MSMLRFPAVIVVLAAAALPSVANDTFVTLGAGGLVPLKSSEVVMESEALQISTHEVKVQYVFRNNSDHDVSATVAFPLPEVDGSTVENSPLKLPTKDPVNFVGFTALVDGKPLATQVEIRAFKDGQDIAARLRSLGLPLSVLDPGMKSAIGKLSQAQRSQLIKDKLIVEEERTSGGRAEIYIWPWWQTRIQYYWTQRFPARSAVQLQQAYHPVVGGSYILTSDDGTWAVEPYCGGADALRRIRELKQKHAAKPHPPTIKGQAFDDDPPALLERRIQYILTTANNWSGPIRRFRLTVAGDSPEDIVLTCMSGLKRVAPGRYELVRSDFRPDQDLELLILRLWK